MINFIEIFIGLIVFIFILLPTLFLSIELIIGLYYRGTNKNMANNSGVDNAYIVIPAHNEEKIIKDTLTKLKREIVSLSKVLVIADNCTDATASIAKSFGAKVLIRNSTDFVGKGYAIEAGVEYLKPFNPAVIIIFDADCEFTEGSFYTLTQRCIMEDAVIQSAYVMKSHAQATITTKVAQFAWAIKNITRPQGLAFFKINCQLQGSGMAFPARVLNNITFASGSIVEDLELGLKLTAQGEKIIYDYFSQVLSYFPTSVIGNDTQRTRWEHGHLSSITLLPKKFIKSLAQLKIKSCFTIFDAMLPPTVLWFFIVVCCSFFFLIMMLFNIFIPFYLSIISLFILLLSLALVWFVMGREIIPLKDFGSLYKYLLAKINIYKSFVKNRQKSWVRTDRGGDSSE